jgi:methyl-accepting chemotaxis protein
MLFSRMLISQRLWSGFGLLIGLFIVSTVAVAFYGEQTASAVSEMHRTSEVALKLRESRLSYSQVRALTWYYVATQDVKALEAIKTAKLDYEKNFNAMYNSAKSPKTKALAEAYNAEMQNALSASSGLLNLVESGPAKNLPAYNDAVHHMMEAQAAATKANRVMNDYYNKRSADLTSQAQTQINAGTTTSTLIGVGGVVIGAVAAFIISTGITRPINAMTKAMRTIADGDLSVPVPALGARDETGRMAEAVETFKQNGLKLRAAETEADRQRNMTEAERQKNEEDRALAAREQAHAVEAIGAGLSKISRGDLTALIESPFATDYEKLREDFNATVSKLQAAMTSVIERSNGLRAGAAEVTAASDEMARRTEQQAASLEETAAALDQITATVKRTAEGAVEARTAVARAKDEAERSGEIVKDAVQTMTQIDDSARKVSQIIGVVSEIAASAHEQATGLHEVNTAVNQMDQITQQNAAMVEEASAAAHALREEADGLSALIAQFRVSETAPAAAMPRADRRSGLAA